MKRKILSTICLLAILIGCTGNKEVKKVCSLKQGASDEVMLEITISSKKETITSISSKKTIDLEAENVKLTAEEFEKLSQEMDKPYNNIEGVTFTYGKKDKKYIETISVDITDKNIDELKSKGIINMYLDQDNNLIVAEKMIESLENSGMECK